MIHLDPYLGGCGPLSLSHTGMQLHSDEVLPQEPTAHHHTRTHMHTVLSALTLSTETC